MAFDLLKTQAGQNTATIITIELDKCRHTTVQSTIDGAVSVSSSLSAGVTGAIAISGGLSTSFTNADPYLLWDSEIIKVTVDSAIQLTVVSRGHFGTVDASHSPSVAQLKHSGEIDGTCYSFPQTCSAPDSYLSGLTTQFTFPSTQLDWSVHYYNGFKSWSHSPPKVDPGQSMGSRAKISFNLIDSVDNDIYVPYPDRRTSNATLFTKWIARNPNFEGRPVTVQTGFDPLNFDVDNFITREYIIDSLQVNNGLLSCSCLDPLILTDDKKAKAPVASLGTLTAIIDDASTTITYGGAPAFDYGASGTVFVRTDSEVIECTVLSDFVLTIVNRAVGGTEQKDHSLNATVQNCLVYTNVNVVEIIEDLLTNYTTIPARFFDDYSTVIAATSSITLTANINKSESVKKLIDELIKNGDLVMYYDEENQLIKIKQVQDSSIQPIFINEDDNILKDSINFTRLPKEQYTRYTTAWAPNDITKTTGEEYFSIVYQPINLTNELPTNKGEVEEKNIFYNRWLTNAASDITIGSSLSQRVLDRSEQVPQEFDFILDIEDVFNTQGGALELGSIATISSSRRVTVDGSNLSTSYQVLSMKDLGNMKYKISSKLFQDPLQGVNIDFTISTNKENYDLSTEFSPVAGAYVVLIEQGVSIGGTSTAVKAFTTGAQAAGVSFTFIIRGSIEGAGGKGADAGNLTATVTTAPEDEFTIGADGFVGGDAFEATVPCILNVGSGAIWAGGGGVNGGTSYTKRIVPTNPDSRAPSAGNGGSGGQGYVGGGHGLKGIIDGVYSDEGVDGNNGSRGAPGVVALISGGEFGDDSDRSTSPLGQSNEGLSGYAIVSNGNSVTITSGNNPLNIKGRRI
mgnify:CR=1 FL=1|tara:strand:+ start:3491 stop:6055 length:2565 start_codon:yes stop_codon:yes gene_type:complete